MLEYIIKAPDSNRNMPNGIRYFINVGSVMYILFALLSIDRIVLGATKSKSPKNTEIPPILIIYIIKYLSL